MARYFVAKFFADIVASASLGNYLGAHAYCHVVGVGATIIWIQGG